MGGLGSHAFYVIAGSRINLDHIALIDKRRGDKFRSGFNLDRLGDISGRVTFGSWLAELNFEFDVIGWRHGDWIAIKQHKVAIHAFLQVFPTIVDLFGRQFILFVGLVVHEYVRFVGVGRYS